MSMEEADRLLQSGQRSPVLDPYVESRSEEMAVGIERAAAFLQTASRSASAMSRIYASGGGSRIPGLCEVLAGRLRVALELANPLQNLTVREGVFDQWPAAEVAPLLTLSVGLALRSA